MLDVLLTYVVSNDSRIAYVQDDNLSLSTQESHFAWSLQLAVRSFNVTNACRGESAATFC